MRAQTPIIPRETLKFNLWVKYFTDEKDKECYGNATKSAIKAYSYTTPQQYNLASVTGSKNLRKYKVLGVIVADMMGFGFGELMRIGIKKAIDGRYKDFDAFMVRLGYFENRK